MSYAYGHKSGGVGHVLVISGYASIADVDYVALTDPGSPCSGNVRWITNAEYSNAGTTNHCETRYNVKNNP
jgi:hypothetical protein